MLKDGYNTFLLFLGHVGVYWLSGADHELLKLHLFESPSLPVHHDNRLTDHILDDLMFIHVFLVNVKEFGFILVASTSCSIVDFNEFSAFSNLIIQARPREIIDILCFEISHEINHFSVLGVSVLVHNI